MIDAGKLDQRVTVNAPSTRTKGSGAAALTWGTTVCTVWARVRGLSARDLMQAQQANVLATHSIQIRYRDDVRDTHRVTWRGQVMEIASALPSEDRVWLNILAKEVR